MDIIAVVDLPGAYIKKGTVFHVPDDTIFVEYYEYGIVGIFFQRNLITQKLDEKYPFKIIGNNGKGQNEYIN